MEERWQLDSLLSWNIKMIKITKRRMRIIFTHDEADIYEGNCAPGPAAALQHDLQYRLFTRAAVM